MKKLLYLILLLPLWVNAQTNGTIQKTSATSVIRGNFGSLGADTIVSVRGTSVNGQLLQYNSTYKKWVPYTIPIDGATGIISGGTITGLGGANAIVASGTGTILDNTNPSSPALYELSWVTDTIGLTDNATNYLYYDSLGVLNATTVIPNPANFRTRVYLGRVQKTSGAITSINGAYVPIQQTPASIKDMFNAYGLTKTGLVVSAASTNLTIAVASGGIFSFGANFQSSVLNPNNLSYTANSPQTFRMVTAGDISVTNITVLPVGSYNPTGTTVSAIGGGANESTIFTVYKFPTTGNVRILYGQTLYSSLTNAVQAIGSYVPNPPAVFSEAIIIGYIAAVKTATDLSNTSQAVFVTTNKFGGVGGGFSSTALTNYVQKTGDTMTGTLNGTDIVLSGDLTADMLIARTTIESGATGTAGKISFKRSSDGASASAIEQVNDNKLTLTSNGGTRLFDIIADTVMVSALTNGLVKSTSGKLSNAVAGTDYLTPTGSGSGLSGVVLTSTNQTGIAGNKTWTGTQTISNNLDVSYGTTGLPSIQATSTNSGGRALTALANSTLEPFTVTQQGAGKLAVFNLNATEQAVIRNNGSIYTRGQLEVGNLLVGDAADSVMVHRAIDLTVRRVGTTGTGSAVFSASPTFTGTVSGASAGFTAGVNLATSSGSVGVGTTTPDYVFDTESSVSNNYVARIKNTNTTAGTSFGLLINGGTDATDNALVINNSANSTTLLSHSGAGDLTISGSNATKASGTAWINPSDLKLKTNIGEYSKGLKEVLEIKPKTWYFNEASGFDKTKKHLSPIAQELQKIMPEMVSTYKGKLNGKEAELLQVDASDMTWLLVKAIQEQQEIIEKLNQRIIVLENK